MSFRKEEKLKIHKSRLINLMDWIYDSGGVELHKPRIVSSTYFDNDDWGMFKDSEEGSIPRKKIRVRSYSKDYHEADSSSLEIKTSSVEGRYKTVTKKFTLQKIMSLGVFDHDYGICKAKVRITYQRSYYKIFGVRLTIDQNIEYVMVNNGRESSHRIVDSEIAVEIKAADHIPVEYLLDKFPYERVRFSKYSRAINCLFQNSSTVF